MASTSQTINSILGTVRRTGSGLTGRATNAVRSTLTTVRSTTRSTPSRRTTYARNNNSNRSSSRNSRSSGRSSGGSSGGSSGTSNNFQPINTLPTLQNNDISTIPTPTTTPSQPKTISNSNPQLNNQLAQIERYGTPNRNKNTNRNISRPSRKRGFRFSIKTRSRSNKSMDRQARFFRPSTCFKKSWFRTCKYSSRSRTINWFKYSKIFRTKTSI